MGQLSPWPSFSSYFNFFIIYIKLRKYINMNTLMKFALSPKKYLGMPLVYFDFLKLPYDFLKHVFSNQRIFYDLLYSFSNFEP
jgi:hypothetical protein